ncbi:MAG TPA: DUF885 domain-containing protein, partial [Thermoanaerobaculia bacterium]|nr:DUF885 domain-containing protein [Thermoanaerobaculia bacterium]
QITQMGGIHSQIPQLVQMTPKFTVRNYDDLLARLRQSPRVVDQTIDLMRRGIESGITPPRITLGEVAGLIANQLVDDVEKSPIYQVGFTEFRANIPAEERGRIQAEARKVIAGNVIPSLRKLHRFWVEDYYPRTRQSVAMADLPDGPAWYAHNVRVMTTTSMTPDQIHELGLSEVKRIRAEMEQIREQAGFQGSLAEFFEFLRTDPRFFHTTREGLLVEYRDIAKRIDPELPRLFGRLPRLPYGVVPVPEYSEKTQTTAYYNPGSLEAGRPGLFYANTYNLPARPRWEMEALTIHEAVPGHHLQLALAQELEDVPKFRRFGGYTAFVEGWGLYSESLGPELGMYKDPYSKFGQLTYEMWRAVRLVVDTGMHSKGWTRQQAIEFFKENAGKSEHDIVVEIDRYIVWPGQALAYKLGELKFKELRSWATKELGERFNIREFHDTVLSAGALPLPVLETRVREWVATKSAAAGVIPRREDGEESPADGAGSVPASRS